MEPPPHDAEALLASRPEDFVRDRTALARALRADGRREDAAAVASLRKPPAVVLAVNRAARDRPRAARDAETAAARLGRAQLRGDRATYERARGDLEQALELLAEVALAQLSSGVRGPSDIVRTRLWDLLRAAVSDEEARSLLRRGALRTEVESSGFGAFAGSELPKPRGKAAGKRARKKRDDEAGARERDLQARIKDARRALRSADDALRAAGARRDEAAASLADLEEKLRRL